MKELVDLIPNPQNPRQISDAQLGMLAKSLEHFGDLSGFVFNRRTQRLVGGHQRAKVLPENSVLTKFPIDPPSRNGTVASGFIEWQGERFQYREVDWDETTEKAANIAANQHGGSWDSPKLAEWILELDTANLPMELLGFTPEELANLMAPVKTIPQCDEDDAPALPKEAKSRLGDLYHLGPHRLLCGDSTMLDQVEKLMGGEKADLMFTDPPYGVSYAEKNGFLNALAKGNAIQEPIENDSKTPEEMNEFWQTVLSNAHVVLSDEASYYIASPQGGDLMMMMMSIIHAGFQLKHMLIWVKNNHVLGRCDYNYRHEPVLFGWKETGTHKFYGTGQCKTSVWEFDKPLKNDLHPTMKPIALCEEAMLNSSLPNALVLDLFGGSGSTMIAAEKSGRRCFMMEIDPHYCDVIVSRWEKYTGKKAELVGP